MAKWQWAALWKRAAKKQKHEADRYLIAWIKAVVRLGWRGRQARAWKRAAKRWRKRAFLLASDNNSQRAIASQVPYLKERIKDLERQIPARTFDVEDYED